MRKMTPFPLSADAKALLTDGSGRWEYVRLMDGPAAQAMIVGVQAKAPPPDLLSVLETHAEPDASDSAQASLF